jgi:hypothetical protein
MDKHLITEVMRAMGRKGGKAGGKVRMANLTPEERIALAKKAAAKSAEVRSKKAAAKKKNTAPKRTK